jgi:predicted metal-binding membrane protein
MSEVSALEYMLRRDRLIVAVGLTAVVALAWAYLATGTGIDASMADMSMEDMAMDDMPMSWSPSYAALLFVMWWVMMIAMMVPSAAPTVLLFATIRRKQEASPQPALEAWVFLAGYLLIWAGFSLLAIVAQWALERAGLLSTTMVSTSALLGGAILLAAGLYQFTPVKNACLRYCQNPLLFLSRYWQPGAWGALRMGLRHGGYCLGCCWFLMALLFVSGVMNLVWIAGIALYVAGEKLLPLGRRLSRVSGAALIVSGAIVVGRTFVA